MKASHLHRIDTLLALILGLPLKFQLYSTSEVMNMMEAFNRTLDYGLYLDEELDEVTGGEERRLSLRYV